MFALMNRFSRMPYRVLLIAVILSNALAPTTTIAQAKREATTTTNAATQSAEQERSSNPTFERPEARTGENASSSAPISSQDLNNTQKVTARNNTNSPLMFIENLGQFDKRARYQVNGTGATVYFADDAIWLTLLEPAQPKAPSKLLEASLATPAQLSLGGKQKVVNIRMSMPGSNPHPEITPLGKLATHYSYFLGKDQIHSGVPAYEGIRYVDVYPGLDLEISGEDGQLHWQFIVTDANLLQGRLGKDPSLHIHFQGHNRLDLQNNALLIQTDLGSIALPDFRVNGQPASPQVQDNDLVIPVLKSRSLENNITGYVPVSFTQADSFQPALGGINIASQSEASQDLPAFSPDDVLLYSTYLGGSIPISSPFGNYYAEDWGNDFAVVGDDVYMVGLTRSADFPPFTSSFGLNFISNYSPYRPFVAKLNISTNQFDYIDYFNLADSCVINGYYYMASGQLFSIKVDSAGNAYLGGSTVNYSNPLLTANAIDTQFTDGCRYVYDPSIGDYAIISLDGFLAKLDPTGTQLLYASYFGGSDRDQVQSIDIDQSGYIYAAGYTSSGDIPQGGTVYRGTFSGARDAFVAKINTNAQEESYFSYLGGTSYDDPFNTTLGPDGSFYVTGRTYSSNFPVTLGGTLNNGSTTCSGCYDGFIVKMTPAGGLAYSNYLGGNLNDIGLALAVNANNEVFIAGGTHSSDFPTPKAATSDADGFAVGLDANGAVVYGRRLNGSADDEAHAIALDSAGNLYLVGITYSLDFPITSLTAFDSTGDSQADLFITKIDPQQDRIEYSTYLGGSGWDDPALFATIDSQNNLSLLVQETTSTDFPTRNAYDSTYNGDGDMMFVKMSMNIPSAIVDQGSVLNAGQNKTRITGTIESDGNISNIACTQNCEGDPINTHTGAFSFTLADLAFPTSAGDLVFQRSYSSDAVANNGVLGYGWTHNHDAHLIFPTDPGGREGFVLFQSVLGNQYLFKIESDGSFTPDAGVLATLTKSSATPIAYTLTDSQQAIFKFDENGRLILRQDAQGHEFDYDYNAQGQLIKISADGGARFIQIGYDAQGRINLVSDHANRQVSYSYDAAGDLTSATDVLGQTWTYAYDSNHHMTQANDPAGTETVRTEYDSEGRADHQFDGEGNLIVQLVYNSDGSTTVYDALNNTKEDQYNQQNIAVQTIDQVGRTETKTFDDNFRPTEITNSANQTLQMTWSADGVNLLSKTDPASNTTNYTYDSLNSLTSTTDPKGNTTTYTYNGKLLTSSTDALNGETIYTYTPEGYLESVTDTAGRITTYTYDSFGQRTSMTDPSGNTWNYTYDSLGRLVDTTDPRGRVTHNEYNAAGKLIRVTQNYDPSHIQNYQDLYNIVTEYQYDARGNQIAVTDTYGRTTQYVYDDADRLLQTIDPAGNTTTNTYDAAGHLISTTDPLNHTTTYEYDAAGRLVKTINALGYHSGVTTFDVSTNTSTVTDMLGRQTVFHYDELGRVVQVVDPLGNSTTTTYDENGNVATRADQLGRTTTYEYDALNRLIRTTDPNGGVTQTVYDTAGNRTATIDPLGHQTTYTYDAAGRLIATTDPLNRITRTEYDSYGRRAATIDAAGHRTTYTYDLLDRVIAVTDPTSHTTYTTYDALGNVLTQTDANGNATTTTYDVLNRPATVTDANGNTTTNTYDAGGNLVAVTDALGQTTTYTYDALNRRKTISDPLGNTTESFYDALGNLFDSVDANGVVTHYVYDELNRQKAVILNYKPGVPADAETNVRYDFVYNEVGNRVSVKDPNGNETHYTYDTLNRVLSKSDPLGNTWTYTYDLAGNRISATDAKNQTIQYTYDAAGQLTSIDYPGSEPDVSFTYDATGQRIEMTDGLGTTTWTYDDLNRAISVTDPFNQTIGYSYDAVGNRTELTYPDGKTVSYTFDDVNHLTGVTDWDQQGTDYAYDAVGHLSTVSRPNGVFSQYTYDQAGRLVELDHNLGMNSLASYTYTYDPVGNRTQAIENVAPPSSQGSLPSYTNTPTETLIPSSTPGTPIGLNQPDQQFGVVSNDLFAPVAFKFNELRQLQASPTVFVVNSAADTLDSNTSDGVCSDSTGNCTLRAAIQQANATAGADTITFNIPGTGVQTIQLTRQNKVLPTITDPVIIDATTQPGYSPSTPMIQIDGSLAGAGANGIRISAGSSTVRGLIINRFSGSGIRLDVGGGNMIQGNFIGTDATGSLDLGNGYAGVEVNGSPNNQIGGTSAETRNLISGNEQYGIYIYGSSSSSNQVQGNLIGTTLSGSAALGNYRGMYIQGAPNNVVGGTSPGAGNVISASAQYGLYISDAGATGNLVQGNLIGTDISGTIDLGNANRGVHIQGASNNTIGGTEPGAGNIISGNDQYGVYIYGTGTNGNIVQGNTIGLGADGAALGNSDNGIYIQVGAANNTIGGTVDGAGNVIASNGGAGVLIYAGNGNAVLGNSIHDNASLGIDLYPPLGITPNDAGDTDTGTNNLQNFPVITSASSDGSSTTISGTLNSNANGSFRLEFFSNQACDPSGNGEGQVFLGATDVTTDASGNVSFSVSLPVGTSEGSVITSTATDAANNSSEFSTCSTVMFVVPTATNTSTPTLTATATATSTSTSTPTETLSPTPTDTSTSTPTETFTPTAAGTSTATPTDTLTPTETSTSTPTFTPTPYPSGPLTIDYTYDPLNRLLSATYSDGRSFGYTYDPAGNVLQLEQNLGPGTVVTTYTYDAANQLDTAQQGSTTWQYTYDANGSLISDGVKTYTYDSANRLIQVSDQSLVTTLSYNGLGQRLRMDSAGVIAHYVMDGNQPLTADSAGNTTYHLYGLGAIGEKTDDWSYSLLDGTNTPRQLTDLSADITLSARYTPWGDTLETYGAGNFTFGYFGSVMDAATGLLYVGNGQYYDPTTGRFLTRDAKPNNSNPYVPWDPTGAIIGPLGVAALLFGKRKKGSKWGTFLVLLVVLGSLGMTIAACGGDNGQSTSTPNIIAVPVGTDNFVIVSDGTVIGTATAQATPGAPNIIVTATVVATSCATIPPTPTPPPTGTPTPNGPTKLDEAKLSVFGRGITGINGLDFYKWYKDTLYPQTSAWWWADFGYDGDGFTITDAFAVVYVFETQNNWSNQYIPEASVRAANEWCIASNIYGRPCGSKEEYVNWFAAYYQSAGNYVAHPEALTSAYNNYKDAMSEADFKTVSDNGASIFSHPNSWNSGCNAAQERPCGWANPSTYKYSGRDDLARKMLSTGEKYFFAKTPNDPDPWEIPSGCIYVKWVVNNWLNETCPLVR